MTTMQSRRECEKLAPVGYTGMLNRESSTMGKLEGLEELFASRHFESRRALILLSSGRAPAT